MEKDSFGSYTLVLKSSEMTKTDVNYFCSKYGNISKLRPTSRNRYYISFTEKAAAEKALEILQLAGKNIKIAECCVPK